MRVSSSHISPSSKCIHALGDLKWNLLWGCFLMSCILGLLVVWFKLLDRTRRYKGGRGFGQIWEEKEGSYHHICSVASLLPYFQFTNISDATHWDILWLHFIWLHFILRLCPVPLWNLKVRKRETEVEASQRIGDCLLPFPLHSHIPTQTQIILRFSLEPNKSWHSSTLSPTPHAIRQSWAVTHHCWQF